MNGSKLANLIIRGVVQAISGNKLKASIWNTQVQDDIDLHEFVGLSSRPSNGSGDVYIFSLNGYASRRFTFPQRGTIVAQEGETIVYSPDGSSKITMKDNGCIEINAEKITLGGREVLVVGDKDSFGGPLSKGI